MRYIFYLLYWFFLIGCTNQNNSKYEFGKSIEDEIQKYYLSVYKEKSRIEKTYNDSTVELNLYKVPDEIDTTEFLLIALIFPRIKNSNLYGSEGVLVGDLNGDNNQEIIVAVQNEGAYGGNLWWQDFFVFNLVDNKYKLLSVNNDGDISGCSQGIFRAREIKNGILVGESQCYDENDPHCCPSLSYRTEVKMINDSLVFFKKSKQSLIKYE